MADLKISALNALSGADLVAADVVAVVDDSASETKKLTVSDLIANGTTLISDATIPSAKILFSAGAIDTAELAASAVETAKINDSAVTAAKLADNSSVTLVSTLPASGDFVGQVALDTDDSKVYVWSGSAWTSVKGAGSINVVNGSTTGEINIVTSTSGDTVTVSATLDNTTAAAQFLAGPTGAGGTVGYRAIIGTDLPTATTTAKGGVIVNGNGLTMSSDTIAIDNTVTAETEENHIVQYDANGLVTGGRAIVAADVPVATSSANGIVKPGSGLGVTGAGELNHNNSVSAGTASKVTFDAQGHITGTESLVAADIPDLDADKITTGAVPTERIASDAITADKLANYTVAQISETTPTADFTSQFFFNPITRDLFLWDGNVFQPVGISAGEIVLAGTYDASTNLLDSVTADGTAAGFSNGSALPAAATGNNRHYVVVSQSGTGSAPAPTVTLEPPDILLSNGTSYVLIETSETITAQVASNVGFTPTGNIAGTNVQAALSEVDSEKLAKGGDTMTGDLTLNNVNVVFEGATENAFETTLTVTDPTADNTLSLPNNSGSLVSTGDTGTVTSTMIADGTIANADISASAEIAVSKLANGTARQLLQTDVAGSGVEFTSNIDVPGTLDVTGAATLDSTLGVTGVISADGKVKFPAGSASAPSFYSGTDTNTGLYFSAADEISVATGGTQRVVVNSSGNVGIGTASAGTQLEIAGSASTLLRLDSSNGSGGVIRIRNSGTDTHYFGSAADFITGGAANQTAIRSNSSILFGISGSEKLRIDSSGNVGIGTTAPASILHVNPSADCYVTLQPGNTDGNAGITIQNSAGTQKGYVIYDTDDNYLRFGTNNTERLRIDANGTAKFTGGDAPAGLDTRITRYGSLLVGTDSDTVSDARCSIDAGNGNITTTGKVGIGETSTDALLVIKGNSDANTTPSIRLKDGTDTREAWITNTAGDLILNNGGNDNVPHCKITLFDGNIMGFATANTERMRIDSSGRLLVGTTSAPAGTDAQYTKFAIRGNTLNSNASYLSLGNNKSTANTTSDDNLGIITFNDNDSDAGEYARITGASDGANATNDYPGKLMFATTADGASAPTERMRISSNGAFKHYTDDHFNIYTAKTAAQGAGILALRENASGFSDGTIVFRVASNGNVTNTNNSYGSISDVKLKENIADANSQWDDIKDLRVRNYNFIEGQTHTQIGVVAQEVETVSPGLVTESPDLDAEGNDLGTTTKSVNYSVLYMKAVKALQEAMDRIETLEAKVAALEAE